MVISLSQKPSLALTVLVGPWVDSAEIVLRDLCPVPTISSA